MVKRKRRWRALPSASYIGSAPKFEPTQEQWESIGGAYCNLDANDKACISVAVARYLRDSEFEAHVRPLNELLERLDAIRGAAQALYLALAPDNRNATEIGSIALERVTARLQTDVGNRLCQEVSLSPEDTMGIVASIMVAATAEKREMNEDQTPGIQIHDAWGRLARDLMDWAEGRDLHVTIANRTENSKNWPSPFVQFFSRLQDVLPIDAQEIVGDGPLTDALRAVRKERARHREPVLGK